MAQRTIRHAALALLLAVVLATTACGYRSLNAPRDATDATGPVARVALVSLRNDSREPWLERIVSDALRREVSARGRFNLVSEPSRADYVGGSRARAPRPGRHVDAAPAP